MGLLKLALAYLCCGKYIYIYYLILDLKFLEIQSFCKYSTHLAKESILQLKPGCSRKVQ